MRLIDADALVEDIEEYQKSMMFDSYAERMHFDDMIDFAVDHLEEAPTIDAVPVVRCKDCVHSAKLEGYHQRRLENGLNCNACRGENGYGIAKLSLTTPDGYCDYGLRRSSDANE